MKKLLVLCAALLSTFSNAAYMNAQCSFNQAKGICVVRNNLGYPIRCNLYAVGMLSDGTTVNAYVNGIVYPGKEAVVYVYAQNPYLMPLIDVQGNANCSF